jgi:DNA-binding SARP family transcriptional activator
MLRIRLLGNPTVTLEGGPVGPAGAQRKPLAVLALLAAAGERGESRDKLVAYLWSESSAERASHRLNQTLHALRRDLAAEPLFLGTSRLRLNPELATSDLAQFVEAAQAGDRERAVNAYGGPFLDGFHLRAAPEFDRWLEGERASLGRQYQESLESLAASAAAAGDPDGAARWLRRLAEHDPVSSRVTINLMTSLAASGRRAEALKAARRYAEHLQAEYEAAPSPAVLALASNLREIRTPQPSEIAVAILPIVAVGSDAALAVLAQSTTEELTQALGREKQVRVLARTSVQSGALPGLNARSLGERLGAAALVEATVRRANDRVRLMVTLVDARDGCQLWSDTLERGIEPGFGTEDALARLVVAGLRPALDSLRTAGARDRE